MQESFVVEETADVATTEEEADGRLALAVGTTGTDEEAIGEVSMAGTEDAIAEELTTGSEVGIDEGAGTDVTSVLIASCELAVAEGAAEPPLVEPPRTFTIAV